MAEVKRTKKIAVVGDQLLSLGFKLAGVTESHPASSTEDIERILQKLLDRDDIGIIVISEGASTKVRDRRLKYKIENSLSPVVIDIPGYMEEEIHAETLRKLIMRVVGIEIVQPGKQAGR